MAFKFFQRVVVVKQHPHKYIRPLIYHYRLMVSCPPRTHQHRRTIVCKTKNQFLTADKSGQKDDPNEDWCAVCLDGGELMCCDKCPKVFHQNCHIPNISSLPDESETWQCLLCVNLAELPIGINKIV